MSQLAIVGNTSSEGEVVIKCQPLSGLAFFRSNDITMKNIKIHSCGALQDSIIKSDDKIQSAILVKTCNNIQLINVDVINSNGTGIVLYNPSGMVHLDMCNFTNNSLPSVDPPSIGGGGGLVIEADDVTANYDCMVLNSTFLNNTAKSRRLSILSQASNPSQYFGLGGGITIVFREGAINNTVKLAGVRLENNIAQFGGGLYLAFFDSASGNYVTIDGIEVTNNTAMLEVGVVLPFTSGGGISIDFASSQVDFPFNNTVEMLKSRFLSNTAQLGGGIAVDVVYDGYGCVNAGNKLLIENCSFDNNEGYQGSSAYFLGTIGCRALLNTTLSFSNFTNGQCPYDDVTELFCLGSVHVSHFSLINLQNAFLFSGNTRSALSLTSSLIELLPSAQLQFTNNNGFNGAALHIVDCSSVIVNDNTSLYFENNNASNYGGAIYTETCTQSRACFIEHSSSTLDPDQWKTNFTFINNQANSLGNSIYMDSVQSCVMPGYHLNTTFCWKGWSYWSSGKRDSCHHNQLRSGPAYLINNGPAKYTVYPGECVNLQNLKVLDDFYNEITDETNLQVDLISGATSTRVITSDDPNCNCNFVDSANCYRSEQIPCEAQEFVLLSNCDEDYASYTSQIMIHPHNQQYGILIDSSFKTCDNKTKCYGSGNQKISGVCSTTQYDTLISYRAVCNVTNLTNSYSAVCGYCMAETSAGMIINTPLFDCIECGNYSGVVIFLIQIILVIIMMTILAVLHINITNGNLNAYILYSQMVTLQFPGLGYTAWTPSALSYCGYLSNFEYISIPLTVYSIWNLNFLNLIPVPFCIPGIRSAVGVILLQYVTAACPLLFIIVSYTWIQCYNNGYRLVVYTSRPVHRLLARFWQKFKIKPSLIDTYAGLLLLAYMRFLAVSVKLLMLITFDGVFGSSQVAPVPLVIIPILCLLVFVILPMAVLLLYPFKIFQRCLTCCRLDRPGLHALVDAYQGCFKNSATDGCERRYFAGFYLLFRFFFVLLVFFLSLRLESSPLSFTIIPGAFLSFLLVGLVLILRPYRKTAHNIIDFLTLLLMIVFAGTSITLIISTYVTLGPLFLPFLVLIVYLFYLMFKPCCCANKKESIHNSSSDNDNNSSDPYYQQPLIPPTTTVVELSDYAEYPDRMVHPDEYT